MEGMQMSARAQEEMQNLVVTVLSTCVVPSVSTHNLHPQPPPERSGLGGGARGQLILSLVSIPDQ